ncbi:putative lipid II flippase FtsW [bacterium]|nr:putative lipid II flippase FtsW [bacterium]
MDDRRHFFIALVCVLLGVGTVMVHSASITSWPTESEGVHLSKHLIFLVVGIGLAAAAAKLPMAVWFELSTWLFVATGALLVVVLLPSVGTRVNGAQRWIRFGSFSIQPSEMARLSLILLVCRIVILNRDSDVHWLKIFLKVCVPVAIMVPLVLAEPDLGSAVFFVIGSAVVLFLAGCPLRYFALAGLTLVPAVGFLFTLRPYQLARITGFMKAWQNVNDAPWQIKQSLVSLGAGGPMGRGIGRGWQKLSYLPEANTDFVFAVVGEELGLIGTLGMVAVWIALYLLGLRILSHRPAGSYARVVGTSLLTMVAFQGALNIAVVTAMVPPKGFPHPFVSYASNNLLVSLIAIGIVLSAASPIAQSGTPGAARVTFKRRWGRAV